MKGTTSVIGLTCLLGLGLSLPVQAARSSTRSVTARAGTVAQRHVIKALQESLPPSQRKRFKIETSLPIDQPFYGSNRSTIPGTGKLVVVNARVIPTGREAKPKGFFGKAKSLLAALGRQLSGNANRNYLVELDDKGKMTGLFKLGSQTLLGKLGSAIMKRLPVDMWFHDFVHSENVRRAVWEGVAAAAMAPIQPQAAYLAGGMALSHIAVGLGNRAKARNQAVDSTMVWANAYKSETRRWPTLGTLYDRYCHELQLKKPGTKPSSIEAFIKNIGHADRASQVGSSPVEEMDGPESPAAVDFTGSRSRSRTRVAPTRTADPAASEPAAVSEPAASEPAASEPAASEPMASSTPRSGPDPRRASVSEPFAN